MIIYVISSAMKEMITILIYISIVSFIIAAGITIAEVLRAERKDDNYD